MATTIFIVTTIITTLGMVGTLLYIATNRPSKGHCGYIHKG